MAEKEKNQGKSKSPEPTTKRLRFWEISIWSCLAIMHSATFGEHQKPNTVAAVKHGGGDVLIWACFAETGHSRVKCETICLTAKTWAGLVHATGQCSQAQQWIYNKRTQSLQTLDSPPPTKAPTWTWLKCCERAVLKNISASLNKIKQHCVQTAEDLKEKWNGNISQVFLINVFFPISVWLINSLKKVHDEVLLLFLVRLDALDTSSPFFRTYLNGSLQCSPICPPKKDAHTDGAAHADDRKVRSGVTDENEPS